MVYDFLLNQHIVESAYFVATCTRSFLNSCSNCQGKNTFDFRLIRNVILFHGFLDIRERIYIYISMHVFQMKYRGKANTI